MKKNLTALVASLVLFTGCKETGPGQPSGTDGWLKGTDQEKFETIAKQLRGLDMAMVETGYRYSELYWAGQDGNWEYANYQLNKIKTAVENGLERRPKRAASAQNFLNTSIPGMRTAIEKKDTGAFNQEFRIFQSSCRACHVTEKVAFIHTPIPQTRLSPVKFTNE
jgi:hypothetical protein